MSKIRIEREDKQDLVVNGKVFKQGFLYHIVAGENKNHAYYLKRIYQVDGNWMLKLGDYAFDVEIRSGDIEISDIRNFKICDCSFECEGYILNSFNWNSRRKNGRGNDSGGSTT